MFAQKIQFENASRARNSNDFAIISMASDFHVAHSIIHYKREKIFYAQFLAVCSATKKKTKRKIVNRNIWALPESKYGFSTVADGLKAFQM